MIISSHAAVDVRARSGEYVPFDSDVAAVDRVGGELVCAVCGTDCSHLDRSGVRILPDQEVAMSENTGADYGTVTVESDVEVDGRVRLRAGQVVSRERYDALVAMAGGSSADEAVKDGREAPRKRAAKKAAAKANKDQPKSEVR